MSHRTLTSSEIAAYQSDGVVMVEQAVSQDWIEPLLTFADQQLNNPSALVNDVNAGADENRLFTDRYLWRRHNIINRFVHQSGCAALAAQAMKSSSVRFYFDHLLIKKVNTAAATPWHQDAPYWPFKGKQIASIWVALTPVTVAGSGMEFIRGSHLDDVYYLPEVFNGEQNTSGQWAAQQKGVAVPDIEADRAHYDIVSWDMKPGDALIFSAWILHGAPGNASTIQDRIALSTRWLGDDVIWDPREGVDPSVDPSQVIAKPGQAPVDNAFFPEITSDLVTLGR